MAHIIVYCSGQEEAETFREQFAPILEQWDELPLYHEFISDRSRFLQYIRGNPYLFLFVAESGPSGKETVRLAKETNPKAKLVWFAREDYALDAFALHITHFARLPVNREKLASALEGCLTSWSGIHISTMTI